MNENETLRRGAEGEQVRHLQQLLKITVDGYFGGETEEAVTEFQREQHMRPDGIVGPETWQVLLHKAPSVPDKPLENPLVTHIVRIAGSHPVMRLNWPGRGVAPLGYVKGVTVSFANALMKMRLGNAPYVAMAKAAEKNKLDALVWYQGQFSVASMRNNVDGEDTLRHLFVLLLGLGMRESSGKYCEGRDMSASNTSASSAEAGAWQMSWDAHVGVPLLRKLMDEYDGEGLLMIYREGVNASASGLRSWGLGQGLEFQRLCKSKPDFAAQAAALGLRSLRNHWGPVNRFEVQIKREVDDMLKKVQDIIVDVVV